MKEYIVNVREVHVQPVLVEADSPEDAISLVDTASEDYTDLCCEYSHLMGEEFWTVEEIDKEEETPNVE